MTHLLTGSLAGRTVGRVGYGAMQLSRLRDDRAGAIAVIRRAVELGVDHIDTAQFYGNGLVNDLLREALPAQHDLTIVTKVGATPNPGGPIPMRPAQRPHELRADVLANLRALGLEQLPVVNLRRMDHGSRVAAEGDQVVDLDDQLAAMVAMRDEGLIGGIGLSSIDADTLQHAAPVGIACVQNAYSLMDRSDDRMLEFCSTEGIAWVPFFPLGGAFPGAAKATDQPVVQAIAERLKVTASQVGLAWLLHRSDNMLLIPGTASIEHLESNIAAGSITLDAATLAALDAVSARNN